MSIEAMSLVLHHSTLPGPSKLVLLGIANHEGDGGAFPSIATLARYANCSERTVQRHVQAAVDAGELAVETNAGGRPGTDPRYRPNLYRVLVCCPPSCDGSTNHRDRGVSPLSPLVAPGVTDPASRGDRSGDPGVSGLSPEPSREPSVEPFVSDASGSDPAIGVVDDLDVVNVEARLLAEHLADWIERNGSKRPNVTETWVRDMRRILTIDGRTAEQVRHAIDWCQADPFWRANILSPVKLRAKYEQMRLQATRTGRGGARSGQEEIARLSGRSTEDVAAETLEAIVEESERLMRRNRR